MLHRIAGLFHWQCERCGGVFEADQRTGDLLHASVSTPSVPPPRRQEPELPPPDIRTMVHRDDPDTSFIAAASVFEKLTQCQRRVIALLQEEPLADHEMHARYVERFGHIAYSTARTRRGELRNYGLVEDSGETRIVPESQNPAVVWRLTAAGLMDRET